VLLIRSGTFLAVKFPMRFLQGVLQAPVTDVRDNAPFGVLCEIRIPVAGLREHKDRSVAVTTSWELRRPDDPPRLVTAYIDG
jgi:hypothetical protein